MNIFKWGLSQILKRNRVQLSKTLFAIEEEFDLNFFNESTITYTKFSNVLKKKHQNPLKKNFNINKT